MTGNTLRIERNFTASPEKVWDFVTKTEHLVTWWGPEGTELVEHDLDFTRLGPWWFVLRDPRGGDHKVSGTVLAIEASRSVEFTLGLHKGAPSPAVERLVRFSVAPDGQGGTVFVLTHEGLTTEEMIENNTKGWSSTLGRLQKRLEAT